MKPLRLLALGMLLVIAGLACLRPSAVQACAAAPPRNVPVAIADESAIILWDEKSQTEHFIRRASFKTEANDFGFLVPTPRLATIAEASDEAFKILAKITEPKVVTQKVRSGGGGCNAGCPGKTAATGAKAMPEPKVEVLDSGRVSGFQYHVLKSTSADELSKWLDENQYDFSPALKEWARYYIDNKWLITAFKVEKGPDGKTVATRAVRMTFSTPKPFFPYREPESTQGPVPTRLLRVFFLSAAKMQGTLGEKVKVAPWPGLTAWAGKITAADRERILEQIKLPKGTGPESWWLTEFEDYSSPRPGNADVYFNPSGDDIPVERPPHIEYVGNAFPDCVMCYALIGYLAVPCLVRRWRRRKGG